MVDALGPESGVRLPAEGIGIPFSALIRGSHSLGALLDDTGIRAARSPAPGSEPYFSGAYVTRRHGSRDSGAVDGVQLEIDWEGVRDTAVDRMALASALTGVLQTYLLEHDRDRLDDPSVMREHAAP